MKRRIAIVLLPLAGGAIVNVAVAWTMAIVIPYSVVEDLASAEYRSHESDSTELHARVSRRTGTAQAFWHKPYVLPTDASYEGFLPREWKEPNAAVNEMSITDGWMLLPPGSDKRILQDNESCTIDARGWPFLSLRARVYAFSAFEYEYEPLGGIALRQERWSPDVKRQIAEVLRSSPRDTRRLRPHGGLASHELILPYEPIWPGFIINTLFYALLLWLLFFAPFAARRIIRRRRGQCEKCAYPIGVSPVCTECGAAVARLYNVAMPGRPYHR